MTVIEDYSPIKVGDTGAIFAPVFQRKDGSYVNLTGATISAKAVMGATVKTWNTASWVIDNAVGGLAHYPYQAADVNTAGAWMIYTVVTIGGLPIHADTKILEIDTAP